LNCYILNVKNRRCLFQAPRQAHGLFCVAMCTQQRPSIYSCRFSKRHAIQYIIFFQVVRFHSSLSLSVYSAMLSCWRGKECWPRGFVSSATHPEFVSVSEVDNYYTQKKTIKSILFYSVKFYSPSSHIICIKNSTVHFLHFTH